MDIQRRLPPLILHPFGGAHCADDLLEGSRASLALEGLIPGGEDESILLYRMLRGRYQEVAMLVFLGKDIFRWFEQCVECAEADRRRGSTITAQSFASMLVENPPQKVCAKLQRWGVTDRRLVFSRAIGLHSIFPAPPPIEALSPSFLKNYHRYADHAYICFLHLAVFFPVTPEECDFEIYASEEYARKLAEEWQQA